MAVVERDSRVPFLKRGLDTFGKIFGLNVCFVIGCLPVFTIGASLCALYAMSIRLQEDEEETVFSGFFHEYKRSFKQATACFGLIALALFVMFFEYLLVNRTTGFISYFYTVVLILELIAMALELPFLFPLIARYKNTVWGSIKNAFLLSVGHLGSWIKILVAWVAPIAFCVIYPQLFAYIWYLWLLLIFGCIAWGTSYTVRKVFRENERKIEQAAADAQENEKRQAQALQREREEREHSDNIRDVVRRQAAEKKRRMKEGKDGQQGRSS